MDYNYSTNFILILSISLNVSVIITSVIFCGKKKEKNDTKKEEAKDDKNTKSQACNNVSGLLNDDPDLKSNCKNHPQTQTAKPIQQQKAASPAQEHPQSTDLNSNILSKPATNPAGVPSSPQAPVTGTAAPQSAPPAAPTSAPQGTPAPDNGTSNENQEEKKDA